MYSHSDPRNQTTNDARNQAVSSVRSQLDHDVANKIDPKQLGLDASNAVQSISGSAGLSVGAVADRARPILEAEAAARGIKLTHADLDKFENSLRGMVRDATSKSQNQKTDKDLSPNAKTRQGSALANPLASASQNSDSQSSSTSNPISQSLSSGALFSNSESQSLSSPITRTKAGPKLSQVMAAINSNRTETSSGSMTPQQEALALELGNLGRKRTDLGAAQPRQGDRAQTVASIDLMLKQQLGSLLDDAIKGPLTRNMNVASISPSTQQQVSQAQSLSWAGSAARASSGSFGTFVRERAAAA